MKKEYIIYNKKLINEWDYSKNNQLGLNPTFLTSCSNKKAWWICSAEHSWQATINNRNKGSGCPYCSGRIAIKGVNDLLTKNPLLAKEWNYVKNGKLSPQDFTISSGKKVWWICDKGHEWQATINSRNNGHKCPYCSGKFAIKGINDLLTKNPLLSKEWNHVKNIGLSPNNILLNSNKKVWWICANGHEWQATVNSRNQGSRCPYCSGRIAIKGVNDLLTKSPLLAKEWDYVKNGKLSPQDFTISSGKKVWWICDKGHEWQATIHNRSKGRNCPFCSSERNTSFPEYAFIYYLNRHGINAIHSFRQYGFELDIYIPSKKVAIEYDGYYWHKNKRQKDLEKNSLCKELGITLYRVREELPPLNSNSLDFIVQKNQNNLPEIIQDILYQITGENININLKADSIEIENLRNYSEKANSIFFSNNVLTTEWNYIRNGNLKPENFLPNSHKKVWWKCHNGHEWQAAIVNRNKGTGCPYCANQKVQKNYNDLATLNRNLANEWNYKKNGNLTPEDFSLNSGKKVWWTCSEGHEWQATIDHRNKGTGCPYCKGRKIMQGYNDLKTVKPELLKDWCYELNSISPDELSAGSHKAIWWKCHICGHKWNAKIYSRVSGSGCPNCAKNKRNF